KIVPDYTFENAPAPKVIVIPAQSEPSEATLEWIRKSTKTSDVTMSVCTGAFVLHALDSGAVEKLVVGLVADPLAEGTEIGIGSRLECVVSLGHLCGRLREVPLEGRVGALHAGGEAHLLPRRRRLGSRGLREQH